MEEEQSEIVGEAASCSRKSDPAVSIELGLEDMVVNIMCAYDPQVGCIENEK